MTTKKPSMDHEELNLSSGQLLADFKALMADAEALIKATDHHEEGPISSIRAKALETLNSAKENISMMEGAMADKVKVVAEGADQFVHRNPWGAVGAAAGLGLLVGLLISRR